MHFVYIYWYINMLYYFEWHYPFYSIEKIEFYQKRNCVIFALSTFGVEKWGTRVYKNTRINALLIREFFMNYKILYLLSNKNNTLGNNWTIVLFKDTLISKYR